MFLGVDFLTANVYTVSMTGEKINFNNFVRLYEESTSIKCLKPLKNQTYKVLMSAKVDIRVIDRNDLFKFLTKPERTKLDHFTVDSNGRSHRYFYAIPVQAPNGNYVGFIYRTILDKSYASIYRPFNDNTKKIPYLFGFFGDFKNFYRHTTCMPILVCEGAKDAIVLKKMYPYTVSCNTSSLGINTHILANITDKVLLAYDNDPTGAEKIKQDKKTLVKLGCSVDSLQYAEGFKDAADYVSHPQEISDLRQQIKNKINGLIFGVTLSV